MKVWIIVEETYMGHDYTCETKVIEVHDDKTRATQRQFELTKQQGTFKTRFIAPPKGRKYDLVEREVESG